MPTAGYAYAEIGYTWENIIAARAKLAERPMKSAFLLPEKSQRQDVKKLNVN
ncbi:MAG: hypothetical protein RMZ43_034390 [Nostoc sp. CmiVER01]|uniref:hypothetical protein n=1 Tax=Nostoc sp. CmiVER01 TaxID=3075384 RepID=UPI002AD43DAC|nr:hypothetical protein [Nostoc sp. CmiVER01]MDZ8122080.1 hypothetical protein [Nostoc sp. CmiVER01]